MKPQPAAKAGAARRAGATLPVLPKWVRLGGLVLIGAVSYFLLAGWCTLAPVVVAPVVVGLIIGLCVTRIAEAAAVGSVAGLAGSLLASVVYTRSAVEAALTLMQKQQWANQDIPGGFYGKFLLPLLSRSPYVAADLSGSSVVPLIAAAIVLAGVAAFAASLLHRDGVPKMARGATAWVVVALLGAALMQTALTANADFMTSMRTEPANGSYAYDGIMNVKVYYLMQSGQGFYPAYIGGHAADSRHTVLVANGKFKTGSAAMFREPAMFYLWQVLAPGKRGDLILVWSAVFAVSLLAGSYWAFSPWLGRRALWVGPILFPALLTHSGAYNPLFPEWWALIALMWSFFALARGHKITAGALGFAAILFRETLGLWLVGLAVAEIVLAVRDRRRWRIVAAYVAFLAAGVVGYALHVRAGIAYVSVPTTESVLSLIFTTRSSARGVLAPMSYLLFPYGYLTIPGLWLIPLGLVGLWTGLRKTASARIGVTLYLCLFLVYFLVFGATSQYWGQLVTFPLLVGLAFLLAAPDRLLQRGSWVLTAPPNGAATVGGTDGEERDDVSF